MRSLFAIPLFAMGVSGCGVFALQKDFDAVRNQNAMYAKALADSRAEMGMLRGDLDATRARLDNALRANADNGADAVSSKVRINELYGRTDEISHNVDQLQKNLLSSRTEIDARIDELKRAQSALPTPAPPPVQIPTDRVQHFGSIESAFARRDWSLVRTLGHEYVNRYATDEHADDALFLIGEADLEDNRPSSALGEFNRLLKAFPKSDKLDKTLFNMGEAYLALHDCANAKLAFNVCESRFPKEKTGIQAKQRIASIDKAPQGMCAPP